MELNSNTFKIGLLALLALLCFLRANTRFARFRVSRIWLTVCLAYSVLVIHYYYIGYSVTHDTNEILICGAALLILSACAVNAYSPALLMRTGVKFGSAAMLLFLIANLIPALRGQEEAYIDGNYVGTTANANMLGAYLALCGLPLFLQEAVNQRKRVLRALYWLALIACSVLIWLTRSRSAMLVIGASTVFLVLTSKGMRRGSKTVLMLVIAAAAIVAALVASDKYGDAELLSTRTILILQRLAAIAERPGLGWGFNSDVYNYFDDSNIFPAMEKGNTALQALEEFGIPLGLFVIVGICVLAVKVAMRLRLQREGLAFSAVLIGCITHCMFETWLFNFEALLSIYFWSILLIGADTQVRQRATGAEVRNAAASPAH